MEEASLSFSSVGTGEIYAFSQAVWGRVNLNETVTLDCDPWDISKSTFLISTFMIYCISTF